jgi:hypothetical protein
VSSNAERRLTGTFRPNWCTFVASATNGHEVAGLADDRVSK